ncbi:MAG TPA: nucleoside transporter C-terminal domain-containing protein [Burkholderiales bacterium]|nr:nucleoside transporter C-terminal domain-containing protein [Burkholderiales bacterium]
MDQILQSAFGFVAILVLAWLVSENRRVVAWRTIIAGIVLQIVLAAALLKLDLFKHVFIALNNALLVLEKAAQAGTSFVFGYLGGAPLPFAETGPGSSFTLAFRALPFILVISALSSLLFYWRVLPWIVRVISRVLEKTMGVGGAVGLSTAANIFVGMVEAPLFIRPYLAQLSRGELFIVMTCGMAGIAGTVMVIYASILGPVIPDALGHILIASIISAPAAIVVSVLMVPSTDTPTSGQLASLPQAASSMDAITKGTLGGLALLLNIVALLIVLVALVTLANLMLEALPAIGGAPVTLQRALGVLLAPLAWLIGVPWSEAPAAGALLGTKTILNEFIAYLDLAHLPEGALSLRSRMIMTYALCGFANFGSLGILIGGLATMAPDRRDEIVALGLKSIVAGTLATCMTGAVIGMLWTG